LLQYSHSARNLAGYPNQGCAFVLLRADYCGVIRVSGEKASRSGFMKPNAH